MKRISFDKLSGACLFLFFTNLIHAAAPAYMATLQLSFQNKEQPQCHLNDFTDAKNSVKGRANIAYSESDIAWTATCVIDLPSTTQYCALTSQEIQNPDAFISVFSGMQAKVLRAKIVSESDINPDFGKYRVTYHCFE